MPRGFGPTHGVAASDRILANYARAGADRCSFSVWYWRAGGGGAYGSIFRKAGAFGTNEMLYWYTGAPAGPNIVYSRGNVGGTRTASHLAAVTGSSDQLFVWNHLLVTHDQSSGTLTEPVFYFNGMRAASTSNSGDGLVGSTDVDPYVIGNRSDGARNWDGLIAHFTKWDDVLLDGADALALAAGASPLDIRPDRLAFYLPLDGVNAPEPDLINFASASITGTRLADARGLPAMTALRPRSRRRASFAASGPPSRAITLAAALPAPVLAAGMATGIAITVAAALPAPVLTASMLVGDLAAEMSIVQLAADAANRTTAQLAHAGNARVNKRIGGTDTPTPFTDAAATVGTLAKLAMSQNAAGADVAMGGGEAVTAAVAGAPTMTTLTIAGGPAIRLRRVRRWSRALSPAELKGTST